MNAVAVASIFFTLANLAFRVWAWRRAEHRHAQVLRAVADIAKSSSKYCSF